MRLTALANTLIVAAYVLLGVGVHAHLRRAAPLKQDLFTIVLLYALHLVPPFVDSARLRILLCSVISSLWMLYPAWLLWRCERDGMRGVRVLLMLLLMLFGGFMLLRAIAFQMHAETVGFFRSEPIQVVSYLVDLLYVSIVNLACAVSAFRDQEIQLRHLARLDPPTGLYNRYALHELATREVQRSQRYQAPLSLLMLDLDHFKQINDDFGYHHGDLVLQALAATISRLRRESDMAFRVGGEEFLLILPNSDLAMAMQAAERLRQQVAELTLPTLAPDLRFTVSIGCAQWRVADQRWKRCFQRADAALYQAKHAGRNRVAAAS